MILKELKTWDESLTTARQCLLQKDSSNELTVGNML